MFSTCGLWTTQVKKRNDHTSFLNLTACPHKVNPTLLLATLEKLKKFYIFKYYATIVYYQTMPNMQQSNAKYAASNAKYAA